MLRNLWGIFRVLAQLGWGTLSRVFAEVGSHPYLALITVCSYFCGSSQQGTVLGGYGASLAVVFGALCFYSGCLQALLLCYAFNDDTHMHQ
jgi:hypothetical protein